MRFRATLSVAAAIAMLTATIFPFALVPAAEARSGVIFQPHHIKAPPQVKATPVNNVRDFGAVGDGVTDDTNAIQNAANNAAATGKGVFFPAGTYLHAEPITFSGVSVTGVGAGSILVANNVNGSAITLTDNGVSIQNMVVSTQGLVAPIVGAPGTPSANLMVLRATSFTVAHNNFVQGNHFAAVVVQTSSEGSINSNLADGAGDFLDIGVMIQQGVNITVANNLFQNEDLGIFIFPSSNPSVGRFDSYFIAIVSNTIGNVTWPTRTSAIQVYTTAILDIAQNTIQMSTAFNGSSSIQVEGCDQFQIAGNDTWGGTFGMEIGVSGPTGNMVTQNTIHNCGGVGIDIGNSGGVPFTSAIQVSSNAFGECGLDGPFPVIRIQAGAASAATSFIQNNSYQGHLNNLTFYVESDLNGILPENVTGNTQTQTMLTNSL
jgi:hypothetical protein